MESGKESDGKASTSSLSVHLSALRVVASLNTFMSTFSFIDDGLSSDSDNESLSSSSEGSSSSASSSSSSSEDEEEEEGELAESAGSDSMDESTMDSTTEKDDRCAYKSSSTHSSGKLLNALLWGWTFFPPTFLFTYSFMK